MEQGIKEQVERYKVKAELFLKNDIRAFIKTIDNTYYFCDILIIGEIYIYIQDFIGKRKGEKNRIVWSDIISFDEYKEKEEELE